MRAPLNHQADYMALIAQQLGADRRANATRVRTLRATQTLRIVAVNRQVTP